MEASPEGTAGLEYSQLLTIPRDAEFEISVRITPVNIENVCHE